MSKPKLNQPDVEQSMTIEPNLKNISIEECRELFRTRPMYPTLEEVTKEWEKAGFEIRSCTKARFEIYKHWIEYINEYKFHTEAEVVIAHKEYLYISGNFPNEYRQLLIKTLKALEVKDNE